ncbi:hypothetical protein K491DRAFT_720891 [Lophiostoma macrostomum CBS 122681]|uniref:Uncharacterized protein n=1 Tax=Lophiostoma macrostomum CBS 122681 TaxID=1314788 RepID=A0A6A6SUM8_9PLEO|nr:hypothetical protein K491DRAFT_720891 [Lophiostoma macrostomum CBS 122681]
MPAIRKAYEQHCTVDSIDPNLPTSSCFLPLLTSLLRRFSSQSSLLTNPRPDIPDLKFTSLFHRAATEIAFGTSSRPPKALPMISTNISSEQLNSKSWGRGLGTMQTYTQALNLESMKVDTSRFPKRRDFGMKTVSLFTASNIEDLDLSAAINTFSVTFLTLLSDLLTRVART